LELEEQELWEMELHHLHHLQDQIQYLQILPHPLLQQEVVKEEVINMLEEQFLQQEDQVEELQDALHFLHQEQVQLEIVHQQAHHKEIQEETLQLQHQLMEAVAEVELQQ
jgi:hypothetical protein